MKFYDRFRCKKESKQESPNAEQIRRIEQGIKEAKQTLARVDDLIGQIKRATAQ